MIEIKAQLNVSDKGDVFFSAKILAGKKNHQNFQLDFFSEEINLNIESIDYLECLLKVRRVLEEKKLLVLCQGAVLNVHSSRAARDMSDGLKAYALELGKKASMNQLVNIFDPAEMSSVVTIAEQRAFFEKWLNSLKR